MKICFVSSLSTPMMNAFCDELNENLEAYFIFYEEAVTRPSWWLNFKRAVNSSVLNRVIKFGAGKYYKPYLNKTLENINPDILILGGFFIPSNWLAYKWAKKNNIKVVIFTEKLGYSADPNSRNKIQYSKYIKHFIRYIYKDIDLIMAVGEVGVNCYSKEFLFPLEKIIKTQYPVDMKENLSHKLRNTNDSPIFLFPHRLIDTYNPQAAINWFKAINIIYPKSRLYMNGFGKLRFEVEQLINQFGLVNRVKFMDEITEWKQLNKIYLSADIVLSTKSAIKGDSDWSIAEMEAAASGLGFIVNNNSIGLVDFLKKHDSGFVIDDINDIDSVICAVNSYCSSDGLLTNHGKKNQRYIEEYSIPNSAKKMVRILRDI